jgi:hypothetical protein
VRPDEWEPGARMIELRSQSRILPLSERMATLAVCAEACSLVVYGSRRRIIRRVARNTCSAQARECGARGSAMTRFTVDGRVCPHERKSIRVLPHGIDLGAPSLHRVASLTGRSKLSSVNVRVA